MRCAGPITTNTLHQQYRPQSSDAAAIFEAAEQARVEAIGALAMKGVAAESRCRSSKQRLAARGLAKARERGEAPLADVVGLDGARKLTGDAPPECARRGGRICGGP